MPIKKTSFSEHFRQSLIALILVPFGLIAGIFISTLNPILSSVPWIFIVFQPFLSNIGNLGGIYCGNLSTSLHLGLIEPRILNNTKVFKSMVSSIITLFLINGLFIGFFGYFLGIILGLIKNISILSFFFLTSLTNFASCCFMIPTSFFISVLGIKRGFDPDVILYPITATLNDIFIAFIFVANVNLFLIIQIPIREILGLIFLMITIALIGFLLFFNRNSKKYNQIFRESVFVIITLAFLDNVTGSILSGLENSFKILPALLVVYPVLNSTSGAQASMVASQLSSDFPLGIVEPKLSLYKRKNYRNFLFAAIINGSIICTICALLGFMFADFFGINLLIFNFILIIILVNLCTFGILQFLAVSIAILIYTRGLDPDNFGNPILTSISDLTSILFLSLFIIVLI
ncbi:MAG: hypothetical protein EAX96_02160 [Candidatus Lokiarchaeota archaeon]|nr:hypothetical protein [Candidatus Lokiarchaeota archaeon]